MLDQESLHPKTRDTVLAEKKEAALEEEPKEPIFAPPPIVMDPNNDREKRGQSQRRDFRGDGEERGRGQQQSGRKSRRGGASRVRGGEFNKERR